MKNKTKKVIISLSIVLFIIVLQSIGYTYAKYIAYENVTGKAEIAKWAFEIIKEGKSIKNVNLADTVDKTTLVDGKIAPGTSGMIFIELNATGSEVDLEYCLDFQNEQNKPNNLTFMYQGSTFKSLSEIHPIKGKIKCGDEEKIRRIGIGWEWPYETGNSVSEIATYDIIDTQDAEAITEYTFEAVVTATQSE